jgi:regulator of protease activity HflC (stomatin/prohibitin superfamily)
MGRNELSVVKIGIGLVVGFILLFEVFGQVPAGFRGVVLRFGAPTGEVKMPGLYAVTPFVTHVALVNVQIQAYHADTVEAASHDLQDVHSSVTINYQFDPAHVIDIYTNLRGDAVDRVLAPNVQETMKATTAQFTAEQLIQNRATVKQVVDKTLTVRLMPYWITILSTSITQFAFSEGFTKAIESKVVAEQRALTEKNNLVTETVIAQQKVARARGDAQVIELQRNQLSAPGGQAVIQNRWLDKWDGHLPQIVAGNAVPLIGVPGILPAK